MLPLLSALACLYLSIETWLRFLAWLAIGMLLYVGYGRRNARLAGRFEPHPEDGRAATTGSPASGSAT